MLFKFIFFVRNNNDIDHFAPVIWKCAQHNIQVYIIILTHHGYKRDNRILYVGKNENVKIFHILDFLNVTSKEKIRILSSNLKKTAPNEVNSPCVWASYINDESFCENIAKKLFADNKKVLACFDSVSPFVHILSKILKRKKIPIVSLPHGVNPFINLFISKDMIAPQNPRKIIENSIFDFVIRPNKNELRKTLFSYLPTQIKILGSPRFCKEWRNEFFINSSHRLEFGDNPNLKVAFFLRDWGYSISWDEVIRTFALITQFQEVHLIVKHHPRSVAQKMLKQKFPNLFVSNYKNLTILTDQGSSNQIVDWADIIIESGTGMGIEAIIQGKPVLSLEYLHPNRTIYSEYIKNCDIQTRDQLYEWIFTFLKDKNYIFYDDSREKFLSEMIENNDSDVLSDYVSFLCSISSKF